MLTGVELRDGKLYEVDLQPGEQWTQQKYREMNERLLKTDTPVKSTPNVKHRFVN